MLSWLVARIVRSTFRRLSTGDPSAVLDNFAAGARFVFPGEHSWALDTTDRAEITAWFTRFAALRPTFVIGDVVVKGPPWNMRVCTRGADHIVLQSGETYENAWFQYIRMTWGKITEDRVFLDTQRVAELDRITAQGRNSSTP